MPANLVRNDDVVMCEFCYEELIEGVIDSEDYMIMGTSEEPCSSCGAIYTSESNQKLLT